MRQLAHGLARGPDVHRLSRPVTTGGDADFDLTYLRSGPPRGIPVLIIPGGPGLASVLPYRMLRRMATARNLPVIMVEHHGVGLSRQDRHGVDLPHEALTIEQVVADLAAVLDDCCVPRAVVYGSSYGTYLAQALGIRHPDRITAMVLDSPMLTAQDVSRDLLRRMFWDGDGPGTGAAAAMLRGLVRDEVVPVEQTGPVVQTAFEFGGVAQVERLLHAVDGGRGRRTWNWIAGLVVREVVDGVRYMMEPDPVNVIAFRELGYGVEPDGRPLDRMSSSKRWPAATRPSPASRSICRRRSPASAGRRPCSRATVACAPRGRSPSRSSRPCRMRSSSRSPISGTASLTPTPWLRCTWPTCSRPVRRIGCPSSSHASRTCPDEVRPA